MAATTYVVVILGSLLLVRLGLGTMSARTWALYVAVAVLNNAVLYALFRRHVNLRFADPSLTREQIVLSALWGMIPLYSLPAARPIILMFYLPAFSFGMLRFTRRQYLSTVAILMGIYGAVLAFEATTGRAGFRPDYELFLFVLYGILLTWFAVFGGFVSGLRRQLGFQKAALEVSLANVKRLSGLLPICASCKKIRDDKGYWNQIESYISTHSEADFSHSICPDCQQRLYPQFVQPRPP
jgi:hypothetical protein